MTDADPREAARTFLGKQVRDVLTELEGTCNSVLVQSNGNVMVGIQPKRSELGLIGPDPAYSDENVVDVLGPGVSDRVSEVRTPRFAIGDRVKHRSSPFTGTIEGLAWFVSGCVQYNVVGDVLGSDNAPVTLSLLESWVEKIGSNESAQLVEEDGTGGPSIPVRRAL